MARSYSMNAVEDAFCAGGAGQCANSHVGCRQEALDGVGHRRCHGVGVLQGCVAAESDLHLGKVAIAGTTDAHAIDVQDTRYTGDFAHDLTPNSTRSGVEESIDRLSGQARTDIN